MLKIRTVEKDHEALKQASHLLLSLNKGGDKDDIQQEVMCNIKFRLKKIRIPRVTYSSFSVLPNLHGLVLVTFHEEKNP